MSVDSTVGSSQSPVSDDDVLQNARQMGTTNKTG